MALSRFNKFRFLCLLLAMVPLAGIVYAEAETLPLERVSPESLGFEIQKKERLSEDKTGHDPITLEPQPVDPIDVSRSFQPAPDDDLMSSYRLGGGDKLKITVFGEEDLSGNFLVNEEGFISMPLIGGVRAKGATVTQVRDTITRRLADGYLVNPSVAIEVASFRPVYVMGEVKLPGSYSFVTDMSVRNAVAIAGGFTYRANQKSITVMRQDEQNQSYKTELAPDDKVLPGDIITIRERFF